MRSNMFQIL